MAQVEEAKFSCQGCGKSYRWKPELAGRKVKCKCGTVMTAPAKQPGAASSDEPDLDALYDLAEEGKAVANSGAAEAPSLRCPSCKSNLEPGAVICAQCGFNLKTGRKASAAKPGAAKPAAMSAGRAPGGATVAAAGAGGAAGAFAGYGKAKRGLQKESRGEDKTLDFYIPAAVMGVGFGLMILLSSSISPQAVSVPQAALHAGLKLIMGFLLMAIAGIFCVKWGEIAFGEPAPAALKLGAMALGPPAIAGIISTLVHDAPPTGWGLVGFFLAFGMFMIMVSYLFEWDMSEKWVVSLIATVVTMFAVPFLLSVLLHGGHIPGVSAGISSDDKEVDYSLELGGPKPLKAWMEDSKGRIFGSYTRDDSEALYKDLYAIGPKDGEIWVVTPGKSPQAAEIYVKLPSDAKKRKAYFDLVTKWNLAHQRSTVTDGGEKWMIIPFMAYSRPQPQSMF